MFLVRAILHKLSIITDPNVHFDLLRFCQHHFSNLPTPFLQLDTLHFLLAIAKQVVTPVEPAMKQTPGSFRCVAS